MLRLTASIEAAIPVPVRGAWWMIAAGAFWAVMAVAIRSAGETIHTFEVVFFRAVFGAVAMVPFFLKSGRARLRTRRWALHGFRTLSALGGMITWFWAISLMPIADGTALGYAAPLFVTMGAALVLNERVGARRWAAVAAGLLGVLIILRPGFAALSAAEMIAVLSSVFNASGSLSVKALARTDTPEAIVFYMSLFVIPMTLVPALFVWTWPGTYALAWLVMLGAAATAGHFCIARAFAAADASAVIPFDCVKILFAAGVGFTLYGEQPVIWTWIGAAVIFSTTLYTAHRETRAERSVPSSPGPATRDDGSGRNHP